MSLLEDPQKEDQEKTRESPTLLFFSRQKNHIVTSVS